MTLQEILRAKGTRVYTIEPRATLAVVVDTLVRHNIGSLVVCEEEQVLGIVTERDILRACAARRPLADTTVGEIMSRELITGGTHDEVETIMGLMTEHRVRHLPLVEESRLVGIISIGDVVKAQHDSLTLENHYLKSYLHG